jgi:hypothetical protein
MISLQKISPSVSKHFVVKSDDHVSLLQMKFAPPPIRPPQPPPNDLHFFWLNRVDLRYYWSFNSLLPKNNIEYIQTGPGDGFEAENSIHFLGQSILFHNLLSLHYETFQTEL